MEGVVHPQRVESPGSAMAGFDAARNSPVRTAAVCELNLEKFARADAYQQKSVTWISIEGGHDPGHISPIRNELAQRPQEFP